MRTNALLLTSLLALALGGCAKDAPPASTAAKMEAEPTIVTVAAGAGQFNTLVAAVKAADLVATLQSPGPFTVFAAVGRVPVGEQAIDIVLQLSNSE